VFVRFIYLSAVKFQVTSYLPGSVSILVMRVTQRGRQGSYTFVTETLLMMMMIMIMMEGLKMTKIGLSMLLH